MTSDEFDKAIIEGAVQLMMEGERKFMSRQYTYRTIEMAKFYIPEGMYSIAQLEKIVADFKEAKEIQDRHLKDAIKESGEE